MDPRSLASSSVAELQALSGRRSAVRVAATRREVITPRNVAAPKAVRGELDESGGGAADKAPVQAGRSRASTPFPPRGSRPWARS